MIQCYSTRLRYRLHHLYPAETNQTTDYYACPITHPPLDKPQTQTQTQNPNPRISLHVSLFLYTLSVQHHEGRGVSQHSFSALMSTSSRFLSQILGRAIFIATFLFLSENQESRRTDDDMPMPQLEIPRLFTRRGIQPRRRQEKPRQRWRQSQHHH